MSLLKKLAGQTAIYGLSSMVGRLLNYFLVPLYTHVMDPATYGVSSWFYAFSSFAAVIFTYGMETAFFRFYFYFSFFYWFFVVDFSFFVATFARDGQRRSSRIFQIFCVDTGG
jgi:hypothetical protein